MGAKDPRVDAYIRKAAPFARPILTRLRKDIHELCPDAAETLKWRMPSFEYEGLLCGFAAFKHHCTFGFWKHSLVVGDDAKAREAMGSFGRITSTADLPSRALLKRYMRKAMRLNEQGIKAPREKTRPRRSIAMHPDLKKAIAADRRAAATFKALRPSHQREYLEWIAEAKREETRTRRVAQAVGWLAEGKPRSWKYTR